MEINFSKIEEQILEFWKKDKVFEKSIENRAKPKKILGIFPRKIRNFVFFEGPPTANAKPGIHHILARVYKDIICRYKTMQGFRVLRKAGWDTHGLPVELEIEKKLGFKTKQDIEKYGIANFNRECKKSVWEYKKEWEDLTERIGFWLDMEHSYITYENDYIETLWWEIKKIWQKGLLYQDYKVVPYCPRCGTALSAHEVAQGYQKIKEPAVFLKLKIKNQKSKTGLDFDDAYLLVWTTTPWTLPANVAIAANPKIKYVKVKVGFENFILAKDRVSVLEEYKILEEFDGRKIIGLKYEPIFVLCDPQVYTSAFRVIEGDFVNIEEGTGLVHIAPAFGEDDLAVVKKENKGVGEEQKQIPILMTVAQNGNFKDEVRKFAGMFVKDADPLIIQDLKERDILYKEEQYEHDYPFCWRCETPLLYYAKKSWFIGTQKIRKDLQENNQKINWVPDYLKEGRFGEWLKELKDWAVSRERYWGTPLPVWRCEKCKNIEVIGSRRDLFSQKFSKNRYLILRHGYSLSNEREIAISTLPEKIECPVTERGIEEVRKVAKILRKEKVDLIFSSDLLRTAQTAEIVSKELGIPKINFDERLRDIQAGIYEGKESKEYHSFWKNLKERFIKAPPAGESYNDVKMRIYQFLKEIDKQYEGKTILIVGHQRPLDMLRGAVEGLTLEEFLEKIEPDKIKTGEVKKIEFRLFPYNQGGELDFHRPFIDEIEFFCKKCGDIMRRVPEVSDCWFDSGSMPFAQWHWPFENKEMVDGGKPRINPFGIKRGKQFPADFISEAVDQTRGWFYTLLAVSTLLGFENPFKNVISLGHVLDKNGEKMSKSKGNVVDPWEIIGKYGADVLRWYFFTINQPGDAKRFDEGGLRDSLNKFILTLWNSYTFFETYTKNQISNIQYSKSKSRNLLDKWIVSKINRLILETTKNLDKYDIVSAARLIEKFVVDDLSNWYIRRSRQRFHSMSEGAPKNNKKVKENAAISVFETLKYVLEILAKLCAPFTPFLAEVIYNKAKNQKMGEGSIHLGDWPKTSKKLINEKLEKEMEQVRQICALGLKLRAGAGIKVRQPLASLKVKIQNSKVKINKELLNLIKNELNIKEAEIAKEIKREIKMQKRWLIETEGDITVAINSEITPELKEEGLVREFIRQIQDLRKKASLTPEDKIIIQYETSSSLEDLIKKNSKLIAEKTLSHNLIHLREKCLIEKEVEIDKEKLWLGLKSFARENKPIGLR